MGFGLLIEEPEESSEEDSLRAFIANKIYSSITQESERDEETVFLNSISFED